MISQRMVDVEQRRKEVTLKAEMLASDIADILRGLLGTRVSVSYYGDRVKLHTGVLLDAGQCGFEVDWFIFAPEEVCGFEELDGLVLIDTFWFEWEH